MGTRFFAVASVALVMGIAIPASAAVIETGVVGKKLTITDKSGLGASSKTSSVQVRTGIDKGAAGNPSLLSGSFEIIYNGTANDGVFPLPSPWIANSSKTAKFSNRSAPVITEVKIGIVKPQKTAKVVAKGVGGLDISTAPGALGVTVVYTVNNGIDGNTYKMCTLYSTGVGSTVQHKVMAGGLAYSLKLKNGVGTTCPSGATTTSTSTSTTVSSSSSSTTLGTTSTSTTTSSSSSSSSTSSSTTTTIATCTDGIKNGQETDTDCGGTQCPACGPGDDCLVNADCTSSACSALICLPTTTSTSSSTSSSSSSTSTSTTTSTSSSSTSSSTTSSTSTSTTTTLPTCTDGIKNGVETDVDCGGITCPACGPGDDCIINADCTSSACSAMICLPTTTSTSSSTSSSSTSTSSSTTSSSTSTSSSSTSTSTSTTIATCTDGFKNGQETGVDCGGPTCSACNPGGGCAIPRDCTSSVCLSMVCATPTCSDGVKNQGESSADCGGPCPDCTLNKTCNVNGDCVSNVCSGGFCKCAVGQVSNTFSITSNSGGSVDPAEWPGGTQVRNFTSECRVTIDNPSGNIDLVGNLGDNFDVISSAGFASCFGSGGEDGNGCDDNGCPPAGIGSCEANRPSCSAALNGSGGATFRVACNP